MSVQIELGIWVKTPEGCAAVRAAYEKFPLGVGEEMWAIVNEDGEREIARLPGARVDECTETCLAMVRVGYPHRYL